MEQSSPKEKNKFYIGDGSISWHTKSPRKMYTVFNEWFRKGMWKPENPNAKKVTVDVPYEKEEEFLEICQNLGIKIHNN